MKTKKNNLSDKRTDSRWAIRPLVPREVYTNRQEHIDYLYNAALDAIGRRTMSTVFGGLCPLCYWVSVAWARPRYSSGL